MSGPVPIASNGVNTLDFGLRHDGGGPPERIVFGGTVNPLIRALNRLGLATGGPASRQRQSGLPGSILINVDSERIDEYFGTQSRLMCHIATPSDLWYSGHASLMKMLKRDQTGIAMPLPTEARNRRLAGLVLGLVRPVRVY